jgi:hypothetical protein
MSAAIVLLLASVAQPCAAEAALRASLAERYPSVTRWEIKPFTEDMPAATDAKVVVLGARSAIEPRPLVARGEEITVRYVSPNVVLTINGVAQNDGAAGDSLLVLNPRSHNLFRAVVSGAREVTIHE